MTILGQHTVAETRDHIRSQQFRINKIDEQYMKVRAQRLAPPSPAQQLLDSDWIAFQKAWTDTRDKAIFFMTASVVANPNVAPFILPAEGSYKEVNAVLHERIPHLKDMEQRVDAEAAALNLKPTDLSGIPSQDSPDADFAAIKKLDAAIAAAGNPLGKPGGTDSVAKSPLGLILIGGAVLAVVAGGLYVKTTLRL